MNGLDPKAMLARLSRMFSGFTPGQRVVTAVAALAVVVGGVTFVNWVGKPSYAPVFTGLSSTDAAAITAKLTDQGEPYQLADGGQTVLVPQADVYQTRITLSGEGLPAGDSGSQGYSLLDKQSMTSSDFQQKVTYQRALEGELSKTIESIEGVQAAVVHLAVPQDDVFTTDATKPTGSVLVKTAPGTNLSSTMVDSIVHLVAGSVPKLDPAQVTVADASGKVLNAAGEDGGGSAGADARQSQQLAVSNATASAVQSMLDKVVGPGKAVVRVDAQLNFDKQTIDRQTYVPTNPNTTLTQTKSKESYTGGGTPVGGVLGPDNAGATGTTGGKNDYVKEESSQTNAVGTLKEQTTTAPGKVQRLTVAVLLDAKSAGSVDQTQLSSLVSAAAGLDPKRGDVVQVSQMAFDTTAAASAQKELEAAAAEKKKADMISLGKTIGLGVLILLALVIGLIRSRRRGPAAPREVEVYRVPTGPAPVDTLLEQAERHPAGLPQHETAGEQRASAREQIGTLARERPDDVARLLRGWIAEGS